MCSTLSEYQKGVDIRGMAMAGSSLAIKIAIAVRGVLISAMLGAIGYAADAAITPEMQGGISLIVLLIPGALMVVSALLFALYNIKDEDVPMMEQEIAAKKAA